MLAHFQLSFLKTKINNYFLILEGLIVMVGTNMLFLKDPLGRSNYLQQGALLYKFETRSFPSQTRGLFIMFKTKQSDLTNWLLLESIVTSLFPQHKLFMIAAIVRNVMLNNIYSVLCIGTIPTSLPHPCTHTHVFTIKSDTNFMRLRSFLLLIFISCVVDEF